MGKSSIVDATGEKIKTATCPKIKAVHPIGSRILIEVLKADEVLGTNLYVDADASIDGAPQAYVVELGDQLPENCSVKVGQRIYWEGKAVPINDPRASHGRIRALLDIHNVKAAIDEES